MIDLFREILQTLRTNRLRTALTGISVSWGVFMLIVLLGVARGVTNSFEERMNTTTSSHMRLWGGSTSRPYHGKREGRYIRLVNSDMPTLEKEHPDFVESVTSTIYLNGNISHGRRSYNASIESVFPSDMQNLELVEGRLLTERDNAAKDKVMVLSSNVASQLFPPSGEGALGKRVQFNDLTFTIVGVYSSARSRNVYIPFSVGQYMSPDKDRLSMLTINLKNLETEQDGREAETSVRNTLARVKDFDPDDSSALWIFNIFSESLQGAKVMGILGMSMWVLGLLTLLTGIVGISNIMFVSVRERTHEIGIRRAIGARPRSILTQVIAEAVSITLLFGYLGIVLGMVVTQIIDHVFSDQGVLKNPTIDISIALKVTLVLTLAGALAGLFPALRALKVKPVEALRDE